MRTRLISTTGQELTIGPVADIKALQIVIPDVDAQVSTSDATFLQLSTLNGLGGVVSGNLAATAAMSVAGTSVYDGSELSPTSADVTFYLDPSATLVNIDGQSVGRTTVETVNNPRR